MGSQFNDTDFTYQPRGSNELIAEFHSVRLQCQQCTSGSDAQKILMQRAQALAWMLRPKIQDQEVSRLRTLLIAPDVLKVLDGVK